MMRLNKFCFFSLLLLIILSTSCKKKSEKELLKEHLQTTAEQYVKEELQIASCDSVVIHTIDTLTPLSYAKVVLEMLDNLSFNYKLMYDEATLTDNDEQIQYLEIYLNQINHTADYFRNIEATESADATTLLLFMVSGAYYIDGQEECFICFANPDFSIHVLDPFADNLLLNDDVE